MTHPLSAPQPDPKQAALWAALRIILLGLVGVLVFVVISEAVINTRPVLDLDARIAQKVHNLNDGPFYGLYGMITVLGEEAVYLLGIVVGLVLLVWRKWAHVAAWMLAVYGGKLLNDVLKNWFERPSPIFPDQYNPDPAITYGFPSGHAMGTVLVYGMLAVFVWQVARTPLARRLIIDLAGCIILLVGVSRILLNVHFLSDVIGGWVMGGLWLAACTGVFVALSRERSLPGEPFPPGAALL